MYAGRSTGNSYVIDMGRKSTYHIFTDEGAC